VIADLLKAKLQDLGSQANSILQGITTVTKSDVVNLILECHSGFLSASEIERLKALHLDQVKYAFWVANKLKAAKAAGQDVTLSEILESSQPLITGEGTAKRTRARRKKTVKDIATETPPNSPLG
jgi:hypothetical protein